ncbi:MAG: glycoside hydrolase family 15 protein, partial [Actinomycetota bacterium]
PDEGIWEVRSARQHFVHSKVMAWVAVDRGIKAIELFGEEGPLDEWRQVREAIRAQVLEKGVDRQGGWFKRSYDDESLDASLLMLPFVGFVDADHPVMRKTIEAVGDQLMQDGFILRYRTEESPDGLPPGEGSFLMCTFWYVDCLVLLGRIDEATELFERTIAVANDLHLLSEQYDPKEGRLLGNFPQAFSHIGLITSALALDSAGQARPMRRGA